jgi:hypothetical protein
MTQGTWMETGRRCTGHQPDLGSASWSFAPGGHTTSTLMTRPLTRMIEQLHVEILRLNWRTRRTFEQSRPVHLARPGATGKGKPRTEPSS